MLIDTTPEAQDPMFIALFGKFEPKRLDTGLYLTNNWNFEMQLPGGEVRRGGVWEDYPKLFKHDERGWPALDDEYRCEYGVCDSPEQFLKSDLGIWLKQSDRRFVVSFVRLDKADQDPEGGWRWHKWGPYIGKQNAVCEYLFDEPEIETVYTYHVYEKIK